MKRTMNRRNWIKADTMMAAGLTLAPDLHPGHPLLVSEPGKIRLHSNENPPRPSKASRQAMMEAFSGGCRYTSELLRYKVLPSNTNFLFFHLRQDIKTFGSAMRLHGIRAGRPFSLCLDWCRLNIGAPTEMQTFINTFRTEWPHLE